MVDGVGREENARTVILYGHRWLAFDDYKQNIPDIGGICDQDLSSFVYAAETRNLCPGI